MQTFLPDPDFAKSARILDPSRLGKQRAEVVQIAHALLGIDNLRIINHPATKMWKGYTSALLTYGMVICEEWIGRGYADATHNKLYDLFLALDEPMILPPWIGGPIHASHRGRLLQKDSVWYRQFKWAEHPTNINFWPVL